MGDSAEQSASKFDKMDTESQNVGSARSIQRHFQLRLRPVIAGVPDALISYYAFSVAERGKRGPFGAT
jgi:hypothetical protein